MIDLHCHILPGIDDGASDVREAIAMATMAARDGIQTIIATPHITDNQPSILVIKSLVHKLNNVLTRHQVPVAIVAGAELSSSNLKSAVAGRTLADTAYLLLEFPHDYLPMNFEYELWSLLDQGLRPIIAHPERNLAVQQSPDSFLEAMPPATLLQVTAGSVTGDFGQMARECAIFLLQRGVVSFLATDAHSAQRRQPCLSVALQKVARLVGESRARALVHDNPRRVLHNISLTL